MTQWFHRNPLKATAKVSFDASTVAKTVQARSLCNDLQIKRAALLKMLTDPALESASLMQAVNQYLPLLMGLVEAPEGSEDQESKLRGLFKFKWSDSLHEKGAQPIKRSDALFELCSILFTVAQWFTKHAAKGSAKENVSMEDAKDIHRSLRQAAGIFTLLKDTYVPKLLVVPPKGSDFDREVLEAYIYQCTAEAQEITMARAIELQHQPSLISGLAYETSVLHDKAKLSLANLDPKVVTKWIRYFQFKCFCYRSYAYVYHAENLLASEKAGEAVVSANEAEKAYQIALNAGREYGKAHGVGISAKPAEHCFFRRLLPLIQRTRQKCERENCMIFHQKVPSSIPDLDLKATFGLVAPETPELTLTPDQRWKEAYGSFDLKQLADSIVNEEKKSKSSKQKTDQPVEHVPEAPIFETDKDPNNKSGCIIS